MASSSSSSTTNGGNIAEKLLMLDMIQDHATKAKQAIVQSALAENKAYEAMVRYQDILMQDESVVDELVKKDN